LLNVKRTRTLSSFFPLKDGFATKKPDKKKLGLNWHSSFFVSQINLFQVIGRPTNLQQLRRTQIEFICRQTGLLKTRSSLQNAVKMQKYCHLEKDKSFQDIFIQLIPSNMRFSQNTSLKFLLRTIYELYSVTISNLNRYQRYF
jgi:hypothetical protein